MFKVANDDLQVDVHEKPSKSGKIFLSLMMMKGWIKNILIWDLQIISRSSLKPYSAPYRFPCH